LRKETPDAKSEREQLHEPRNVQDLRAYSQPVERSWRLAVAMVGQVQWELIEPLDDESVYARFLAEKGEGTDRDLGVITEIFSGTPGADLKPDATHP
jgi:hypothetical protein